MALGTLGMAWYRCRACGIDFQDAAKALIITLGVEIDGQDPWAGWDDNTTEALARAIGLID